MVISTIGWWLLFVLIKWYWSLTTKSTSYAVAFVHGILSCRACEYIIYTENLLDTQKFGGAVTPLQNVLLLFSVGYFLYDSYICYVIKENFVIKMHHVFAVLIFCATMWTARSGPEVIISVWMGEFTNACLNLRYFFQHNEPFCNSKIATLNDFSFGISFILFRFVFGTYVVYHILSLGRTIIAVQISSIFFTLINLYMGKMLIDGFLQMIKPSQKEEEKVN